MFQPFCFYVGFVFSILLFFICVFAFVLLLVLLSIYEKMFSLQFWCFFELCCLKGYSLVFLCFLFLLLFVFLVLFVSIYRISLHYFVSMLLFLSQD